MAGFKINPIALATSQPVLGKVGQASGLASAGASVLRNPALSAIYDAVVPANVKSIASKLLGVNDDETVRAMERRRDPLMQYHHSIILPFSGDAAYVERILLPAANIEVQEQHANNSQLQRPGFVTTNNSSLTFYEDTTATAQVFLNKWSSMVCNGPWYGRPSEYKQDIVVTMHDSRLNPVLVCAMHGCWPASWDDIEAGPDSERVSLQVTLAVDWCEWQFPGQQGFLSRLGIDLGTVFGKHTDQISSALGNQLQTILRA